MNTEKTLRGRPKCDLASLAAQEASKPEASAWLYILKCSIFSAQYKNVHYFRRWLEKYALEKWCD